jgi:hypothetical protein
MEGLRGVIHDQYLEAQVLLKPVTFSIKDRNQGTEIETIVDICFKMKRKKERVSSGHK